MMRCFAWGVRLCSVLARKVLVYDVKIIGVVSFRAWVAATAVLYIQHLRGANGTAKT